MLMQPIGLRMRPAARILAGSGAAAKGRHAKNTIGSASPLRTKSEQ